MNNKSDKKHKRKQKKPKNKKKTTSRQSKKKTEIKGGGPGWQGLFSGNTSEKSKQPLPQNPQNNESSALPKSPQSASSNGSYNPKTKIPSNKNKWTNQTKLAELRQSLLSNSTRFANVQPTNSNTRQPNVLQPPVPANSRTLPQNVLPANPNNSQPPPPPPPPPNAQPQGFNTLKAQSRCSIM